VQHRHGVSQRSVMSLAMKHVCVTLTRKEARGCACQRAAKNSHGAISRRSYACVFFRMNCGVEPRSRDPEVDWQLDSRREELRAWEGRLVGTLVHWCAGALVRWCGVQSASPGAGPSLLALQAKEERRVEGLMAKLKREREEFKVCALWCWIPWCSRGRAATASPSCPDVYCTCSGHHPAPSFCFTPSNCLPCA
jgi:hypothetical protein